MLIVMLDASTLGDDIDFSVLNSFGEVKIYEKTAPYDVAERIKNADIVIVNKVKMNPEVLCSAEKLKLICITATGYDNIDVKYCSEKGIKVANTPSYSSFCVAQITASVACYLMTHLGEYRDFVHSGLYSESGIANRLVPVYHEFYGKTWGIIGYGNIGKAVASVASALGCNVIVNKRTPVDAVRCVDVKTLAKEADIISIHCPLTKDTKDLINKDIFALMKKDVIVINMARGGVWNEADAACALLSGKIGGLGCDVYTCEPFDKNHPFSKLLEKGNVCLTPHMAWGALEARKRCFDTVVSNIRAFLDGNEKNVVN